MQKLTKKLSLVIVALFTVFTFVSYMPAKAATVVPKVQFVGEQKLEYTAGERITFNLNAANYGGRVQYRVLLWDNNKKAAIDLWNTADRYYANWMPYGNETLPLGWVINEPGSYRITVYTKRAGLANNKTALAGFNCDSYVEGPAFVVKPAAATPVAVTSVAPVADVTVDELATPVLPTEVTLNLADATTKVAKVVWAAVDTTKVGTFPIEGTVEGTELKATVNVIVKVVPLEVESVEANNLKQFVVTFNKAVDEDDATNISNYELTTDGIADLASATVELASDAKSVTVTLADGNEADLEEEATLAVSGIADEAGTVMEDAEATFKFNDVTFPTVVSAKVVGNDTIKVTFSEPIATFDPNGDDFEVDGGDYVIQSAAIMNNDTEINIQLYSDLEAGNVELKVLNSIEDYAGYNVPKTTKTVTVVEDATVPQIVGYKDASKTSVTLIFDNDIEIADADEDNFYHTNTNNVSGNDDGDFTASEDYVLDGNELTLKFTENPLPEGTAYVYIAADSINDLWDNENDKLVYKIEVAVDTVAPTLDDLDVDAQDQITLTFSEDIAADSFDEDSFTLLDKNGKVADLISDVTIDGTDAITVEFDEELVGDYSIVVEEVTDLADNEIDKTTKNFTVDDMEIPDFGDFDVTLYKALVKGQMIKIDFNEAMATTGKYSVLDLDKYLLTVGGTVYDLSDVDAAVKIVPVDDNEAVEIYIASQLDDDTDYIDIPNTDTTPVDGNVDGVTLNIARVADAAANYTEAISSGEKTVATASEVAYSVEATATDKVVVTFDSKLTTFDATEFALYLDVDDDASYDAVGDTLVPVSKMSKGLNSDGESTITYTLITDIGFDALSSAHKLYVLSDATPASKNVYGEFVEDAAFVEVEDAIVPALAEATDLNGDDVDNVKATNATTIVLTFEEDLDEASIASSTFVVDGGDYEVLSATETAPGVITITIENAAGDDLVGAKVVQAAAIKDYIGNKVTGISTEVGDF